MSFKSNLPEGFSQDFGGREAPAIAVFGPGGSGKTRLQTTACEWAAERGTIPGWIVIDRNTRSTVKAICKDNGWQLPLIQKDDFLPPGEAIKIAKLDRGSDTDVLKIRKLYGDALERIYDAITALGDTSNVDPICIDNATTLYDWISFSHFGRKTQVGKSGALAWGPPQQDWMDMMDAISHKTVILSFWESSIWQDGKPTKYAKPDGPKNLKGTVTDMIRLRVDNTRRLGDDEGPEDRFSLDVYDSHVNAALIGTEDNLLGASINFINLMNILRPE